MIDINGTPLNIGDYAIEIAEVYFLGFLNVDRRGWILTNNHDTNIEVNHESKLLKVTEQQAFHIYEMNLQYYKLGNGQKKDIHT